MIGSRGLILARLLRQTGNGKSLLNQQQIVPQRLSHAWSYRVGAPKHSKGVVIGAELVGGFMWWWVLWHLYHESEHITGEFDYPDPTKWTDAELGIPSDSE